MKYVGIAALSATFWLLVATLRVAINDDCQLRREMAETEAPAAERRPVAPVSPKLWAATDCGLPGIDSGDRNPISKVAVVGGMNAVRPLVNACYDQYQVPGMVMVMIVINKDGRVCSATTTGKFAGTPTGACVERAVRTAHFPPSDGLSTPYPFVLH